MLVSVRVLEVVPRFTQQKPWTFKDLRFCCNKLLEEDTISTTPLGTYPEKKSDRSPLQPFTAFPIPFFNSKSFQKAPLGISLFKKSRFQKSSGVFACEAIQ